MGKQSIDQRVREIAEQVAGENKLELVHTEIVGALKDRKVRIFIDKPEGVSHEDCALVSHKVGEMIEEEDFIPTAYTLEVSSPGLERGLYSLSDFEKFTGKSARFKTYQAINGQKNFNGKIIGVEGGEIVFEDKTGGNLKVLFSAIAKANLEIDLEEEFKRAKAVE
jgi:ribosome maturation factor RimP